MEANKLPLLAYFSGTKKRFWTHSIFMVLIPDILHQYTHINLQSIFLPHTLNRQYFNLQQNDSSYHQVLSTCVSLDFRWPEVHSPEEQDVPVLVET